MLLKLIQSTQDQYQHVVVSLTGFGPVAERLESLGVPVHFFQFRGGQGARSFFQMIKFVKKLRPDIIQGWMYHANLVAIISAKLAGIQPCLWNVRSSLDHITQEKWLTRLLIKLSAPISWFVDAIIYNARVSQMQHEKIGFAQRKGVTIGNGFDIDTFKPSQEQRQAFRQQFGLKEEFVIGLPARFHALKNQKGFIEAALLFLQRYPGLSVRFVLAGRGCDSHNLELMNWISEKYQSYFLLLGEYENMVEFYNGIDLMVLCSWAEGFPNVLGEAMAVEKLCMTTNVGDAASILGDAGFILSQWSRDAAAKMWYEIINFSDKERQQLGQKARTRVCQLFSMESIARQYTELYEGLYQKQH